MPFLLRKVIRHIHTSLTQVVRNTLATSLVQSRLDYANSILYGVSLTIPVNPLLISLTLFTG